MSTNVAIMPHDINIIIMNADNHTRDRLVERVAARLKNEGMLMGYGEADNNPDDRRKKIAVVGSTDGSSLEGMFAATGTKMETSTIFGARDYLSALKTEFRDAKLITVYEIGPTTNSRSEAKVPTLIVNAMEVQPTP